MSDIAMNQLWATQQTKLEEKDAEIARLKKWNLMTDEQVVLDLKAEIERLKSELETQTRLAGKYLARLCGARELITKLCDALEYWLKGQLASDTKEVDRLLQRARQEVAK
jgi:hypothetical protein